MYRKMTIEEKKNTFTPSAPYAASRLVINTQTLLSISCYALWDYSVKVDWAHTRVCDLEQPSQLTTLGNV